MSKNENLKMFYVGSLITSLVGGILLLFTDFAGWDGSNYYLGFYEYGYIGANLENPLSLIPFVLLAGSLFFCSFVSFMGFQSENIDTQMVNRAFILAVVVMAVVLAIAVIFAISVTLDDVWWWFDAGFYGGAIGSALTVIFLYQIKKGF